MSDFTRCCHCGLHHRPREAGTCPRCGRSVALPSSFDTAATTMPAIADTPGPTAPLLAAATLPLALGLGTVVWALLPTPLPALLPTLLVHPLLNGYPGGLAYLCSFPIAAFASAAFPYVLCCGTALAHKHLYNERRGPQAAPFPLSSAHIALAACAPFYFLFGMYSLCQRFVAAFEGGVDTPRGRRARLLADIGFVLLVPRYLLTQFGLVVLGESRRVPWMRFGLSVVELFVLLGVAVLLLAVLRRSALDYLRRPVGDGRAEAVGVPQGPRAVVVVLMVVSLVTHLLLLAPAHVMDATAPGS